MLKNRESIIKLAVKDYKERNNKGVEYTVHDALAYSLEEHDAKDMLQAEWEGLLWDIEKEVRENITPKYVLWKWDCEVYEIIRETEYNYTIKNIKFNTITKVNKLDVIEIRNM